MNLHIENTSHGKCDDSARRPGPIRPGRVQRRRLAGHAWQKYFIYVPEVCAESAPVLVAVHGISRNAREQARAFAPLAERYGIVVVAPLFPKSRFPSYQQLGIARDSVFPRPDFALDQILREVTDLTGARTERFHLFGYSGGGQFTHRYAMANPERVQAAVMGAPGWYTFPDTTVDYPRGTRPQSAAKLLRFEANRYLRVPMAVLVGAADHQRDSALNQSTGLELQQGVNRLERGRAWVEAMRSEARARNLDTAYEFETLPDCGHSFEECVASGQLAWRAFQFLFGRRHDRRVGMAAGNDARLMFHVP